MWQAELKFSLNVNKMLEYMMKRVVVVSLLAIFLIYVSIAYAQISNESDILGIKLTMKKDEAIDLLTSKYSARKIKDLTMDINTSDYSMKNVLLGYMFDITPQSDIDKNNAEEQKGREGVQRAIAATGQRPGLRIRDHEPGKDIVKLYVDPENSNKILGITREKNFLPDDQPLEKVLVDTFVTKYGSPRDIPNDSTSPDIVWTSAVMKKRDANESTRDTYLSCQVAINNMGSYDIQFVNLVNSLQLKQNDAKCGTAMVASLRQGKSKEYTSEFSQRLVDIPLMLDALKVFRDKFMAEAEKATQKRLNNDASKKPQL
jgi:hypothetical protein